MSAKLCKHLPLLKMLHKATPKQRRLILQSSSDELISTLFEVALNILYGTIPIKFSSFKFQVLFVTYMTIQRLYNQQ